jgi:serine/threonine protein kinase
VRDVERPTIHSDIYSFGSVALQVSCPRDILLLNFFCNSLIQIVTGRVPWSELEDDIDVVVKLSQGLVPWKPEDCLVKDSLWAFIQRCWEFVPEDRPTSSDALDFAEIEFRATISTYATKDLIDGADPVADCEGYQATQPSQGAPAHTLVSARSTAAENHSTLIGTSPASSCVVSPSVTVPLNTVGSARPGVSAPLSKDDQELC